MRHTGTGRSQYHLAPLPLTSTPLMAAQGSQRKAAVMLQGQCDLGTRGMERATGRTCRSQTSPSIGPMSVSAGPCAVSRACQSHALLGSPLDPLGFRASGGLFWPFSALRSTGPEVRRNQRVMLHACSSHPAESGGASFLSRRATWWNSDQALSGRPLQHVQAFGGGGCGAGCHAAPSVRLGASAPWLRAVPPPHRCLPVRPLAALSPPLHLPPPRTIPTTAYYKLQASNATFHAQDQFSGFVSKTT